MKKYCYILLILIFVFTVILVGCDKKEFSITYELDGGKLESAITKFTKEDLPITLPEPTKDGYQFLGWYLDEDFSGEQITQVTEAKNIKVYAKWEEIIDYSVVDEIANYILDNTPNLITKDFELITSHSKYQFDIVYSSQNSLITNDGITFSTNEQETTLEFVITHNGISKRYSKNVTIAALSEQEIFDLIAKHIIDNIPAKTDKNVEFVKSYLGYNFEVEIISSNVNAINSEGVIKQRGVSQSVALYINITMNGRTEGYDTSITILPVNTPNMLADLEKWINENVEEIIAKEEGILPKEDGIFGIELRWYANQPGVIGGMNNLNVAVVPGEVTLTCEYKIGVTTYTQEFKYQSRGLRIEDKSQYIDNFFKNLIPETLDFRTNIIYDQELEIIQSIVPANSPKQIRPKDANGNGVPMPGGPMWVVIHDTGNPAPGADAAMHNRYIHNQANSPDGRVASWHYTVDDKEIYQHVPDTEQAWHAGDNDLGVLKYGNRNGIGIETCINPENDYELTLRRTAKLTAQLLYKYNLGLDSVVQHWHFSQKNCPAVIRANGWWQDFKDMVARELFLIIIKDNKNNSHVLEWTIDKPEILGYNGKKLSTPLEDEIVTITLKVQLEGFTNTYTYQVFVPGMSEEYRFDTIHRELYALTSKTVTGDISLPIEYQEYNATILWISSNPEILDEKGKYTKPEKLTIIKLTAVITINNKTIRREYSVAVK